MSHRTALRGCLAALALLALPASAAGAATVHLRGTAYEFNNVDVLLGGATIRVAEYPRLRTTVRPDGTYDLAVPDRAKVTPYIVKDGYHTIHLQTFTTAGENLRDVNFQTPTDAVYRGLVALLNVPVDENGELRQCAIVSTFSTRNVRGVGFREFIGYGAHGVAGATAAASPALPAPTYFNDQVIPDPAQQLSSEDGGVVWTNVPAGAYTITARSPATRFASFVATCEPGRVVNANPPWGLHELGLRNAARVTTTWKGTRFRTLRATGLPPLSLMQLRCLGRGCPTNALSARPAGTTTSLTHAPLALRPGQTLELRITKRGYDTLVMRWPVRRRGTTPKPATLCVPLGNTKPRRC